ncbi:hypothetical protein GOBAR_AA09632 [Gossypium barbadense]|uniref:Uncharacterized protein n=1 Tax=Gossypium barbadense TaxID=3634 RepID=A0A2P5Y5Z2_GOSBA|nr:hypothetical protein GOBAR_AA09632 [Gossypium barbadense]
MKQSPFKLAILVPHQKVKEMSLKEAHEPFSSNSRGSIHKDRRLQVEELDEWWMHKPKTNDKPKLCQNELTTFPNQLKVGDRVLLDAADPHIVTTKPNETSLLRYLVFFHLYLTPNLLTEILNIGLPPRHSQAHGRAYDRVEIGQRCPQHGLRHIAKAVRHGRIQCRLHEKRKPLSLLQRKGRECHLPRVPPSQPPLPSRPVHAAASYADISERLTRFEP